MLICCTASHAISCACQDVIDCGGLSIFKGRKVKGCVSLCETRHRATERPLPYGITQRYLPPDTGECAPP